MSAPAPAAVLAPAGFSRDRALTSVGAKQPTAPLAEAELSWTDHVRNFMFGNVENKLFQIKLNLVRFKDVLFALATWVQTGPLQPLFTLLDKVGGLFSAGLARLQGRAALDAVAVGPSRLSRATQWVKGASRPIGRICAVSMKWLERSAPIFGWLVAGQDLYEATKLQCDGRSPTNRRFLGWTTAALSAVGAMASTLSAWSIGSAGAAGGSPVLATVAIVAFGLSLLTGWLASRPVQPLGDR